MNRYERERPGTGGARSAVNYAINMGHVSNVWYTFDYMNMVRHEMRRALFGIDEPTAWCGERNARLRRMIEILRHLPAPRLP
jgi:hypothetical protein